MEKNLTDKEKTEMLRKIFTGEATDEQFDEWILKVLKDGLPEIPNVIFFGKDKFKSHKGRRENRKKLF